MTNLLPNRKTIRFQEYDYSCSGLYFITICVFNMRCLLSKIEDISTEKKDNKENSHHPQIVLSEFGLIVQKEFKNLPKRFFNLELHEFIIMPNHIHAILEIRPEDISGSLAEQTVKTTLGDIICAFKSVTTKKYNQLNNTPGLKLWQRNYYEHIIRNNISYLQIADYIISNPANWTLDNYYIN